MWFCSKNLQVTLFLLAIAKGFEERPMLWWSVQENITNRGDRVKIDRERERDYSIRAYTTSLPSNIKP